MTESFGPSQRSCLQIWRRLCPQLRGDDEIIITGEHKGEWPGETIELRLFPMRGRTDSDNIVLSMTIMVLP
jgi:hypothetical protein